MPKWGLSHQQRTGKPWDLPPELLLPAKTITDPIHGDIYVNRLEGMLIDSPAMQRLRRVRQLGTTHLVYPGATHTRLSHSLGTMRAAQDLLDAVWSSWTSPQADGLPDNLMAEWENQGRLPSEFARATVLARLGGLLHDLCHVPLGHTIEDDLQILEPHDHNVGRFEKLWKQLDPQARQAIESADGLMDELRVLIVSKDVHAKDEFKSEYPFVGDIVGNTICADLIDYLQRDHYYTGLPLALGKRFMDSFFVVDSDHPYFAKKMVIKVERDGRTRNDITSELLKYLRYRYELTERVLTHHAKTAADAMLGKMLELWHDELFAEEATTMFDGLDTARSINELQNDIRSRSQGGGSGSEGAAVAKILTTVKGQIEQEFTSRSDDGLLELLATAGDATNTRRAARQNIANKLLNRQLYKVLGHAGSRADQANAEQTHSKFAKAPNDRRDLEKAAADFAGIEHGWEVVVWLPTPTMRLKVADVLVHQDGTIAALSKVEHASGEIAEQHQHLWGVTVYAPVEVRDDPFRSDAVLAYLSDRLGLTFRRPDGTVAPGTRELAVRTVLRLDHDNTDNQRALRQLAALPAAASSKAHGDSFEEVLDLLWAQGHTAGLLSDAQRPSLQ